jgi:hypothetical protein
MAATTATNLIQNSEKLSISLHIIYILVARFPRSITGKEHTKHFTKETSRKHLFLLMLDDEELPMTNI